MATPEKSGKTMSSRLMNMKFMQRAAASSAQSTPSSSVRRSAKRQKLDDGTPAIPTGTPGSATEEATTQLDAGAEAFLARQAELAGDTKWTLDVPRASYSDPASSRFIVVQRGYGSIDYVSEPSSEDNEDSEPRAASHSNSVGRRSFGNFQSGPEKSRNGGANAAGNSGRPPGQDGESEEGELHEDRPPKPFSHRHTMHQNGHNSRAKDKRTDDSNRVSKPKKKKKPAKRP